MAEVPQRKVVFENWPSVQAIGRVVSVHRRGEKVTEEVRYSILSEYLKGEQFAKREKKREKGTLYLFGKVECPLL